MPETKPLSRRISAWAVHFLTASGVLLGLLALTAVTKGLYLEALWWLAGSVVIDSVDGVLARVAGVGKFAPSIDGSLLDNIVDYFTWTIVPLFWAWHVWTLPVWIPGICAIASVIGFSNKNAKTSDHYFTGFPSYWSLVIFHMYLLSIPVLYIKGILLLCAVLVFIPLRWVYPSRTMYLRKLTLVLSGFYAVQLIFLLFEIGNVTKLVLLSSLLYPIYYILLTVYVNLRPEINS